MQLNSTFDYEYTDADNLGLLRTKVTTTSNTTVKKSKKKKVSVVQARDTYYRHVLTRQDSYEERRDFFEPKKKILFESKQRPLHVEQRLGIDDDDKERERKGRYLKETEEAAAKLFDSSSSSGGGDASGNINTKDIITGSGSEQ